MKGRLGETPVFASEFILSVLVPSGVEEIEEAKQSLLSQGSTVVQKPFPAAYPKCISQKWYTQKKQYFLTQVSVLLVPVLRFFYFFE